MTTAGTSVTVASTVVPSAPSVIIHPMAVNAVTGRAYDVSQLRKALYGEHGGQTGAGEVGSVQLRPYNVATS
jgi:hypothetical protein